MLCSHSTRSTYQSEGAFETQSHPATVPFQTRQCPAVLSTAGCEAPVTGPQPPASPSLVDTSPFPAQALALPRTSYPFPLCPSGDCPLWLLSLDPQDQERRRLSPRGGFLFHTRSVSCRALAPPQSLTSLSPATNVSSPRTGSFGSVCPVQGISGEASLSALQRKGFS